MPGTFLFKPIEANLTRDTEWIGTMDPVCSFLVGEDRIKGQVCPKGGKHPQWNDTITISPPTPNESKVVVELLDQGKITSDDIIGGFLLDLKEIEAKGHVSRWYPLTYNHKPAGELFMESIFQPDSTTPIIGSQTGMTKTSLTTTTETPIMKEGTNVFTEQRQVVEPHTFTKNMEIVETVPVTKEVEVMEPVKVIKDVQYTEAVPVTKQIEVTEPEVVTKEVEVIEPRLVTKQIQVVENVPVKKQVEVIENKTVLKDVETFEPQTFTKQVEVTEQVPVKKQVTTTEPVTISKPVEFVEPIITTQTVVKEIKEPVVVGEHVTTTVGPARVVGSESEMIEEAFIDKPTEFMTMEEERLLKEKQKDETFITNDQKEKKL